MTNGRQTYIDRRKRRKPELSERAKWALKYLLRNILIILALIALFSYINWRHKNLPAPEVLPASELMKVKVGDGIPSQEVDYTGFHVSFNGRHHVPNYVCWELTREEARGKVERAKKFEVDPAVKGSATLADYRHSGYDRGHMAPAGDMKWDPQAMRDCHYLTNIIPQDHEINQGIWNTLEELTRYWVEYEDSLIIITGPILTDECPVKIGESGVTVPERMFKIIMAPHANPPLVLAFIIPNQMPVRSYEWYTVSVDEIEELTGLDFFYALPDDLEDHLEQSPGLGAWNNHFFLLKNERRNLQ